MAKAVKKLDGNALAIYLAGGYTGIVFQNLLKAEGVETRTIDIGADTREGCLK